MYKSPSFELMPDSGPYNLMISFISGDGCCSFVLSHVPIIMQFGSIDCSCFHCELPMIEGGVCIISDGAVFKWLLIACCAIFDDASFGMS